MSDELTLVEVERHCRDAIASLQSLPWPSTLALPQLRGGIDAALGHMRELQYLCELVRAVDAGLAVVLDEPPAAS